MLEAMTADAAALHTFWKKQQKLWQLPIFFSSFDWETELPVPGTSMAMLLHTLKWTA